MTAEWREGYHGTGPGIFTPDGCAVDLYAHGVRTVQSPIESLALGELFDVVLLGSFLIHASEPAQAQALLATCARHVKPGGCVLIQREGQDWHANVPRESPLAGGTARVASSTEVRPGVRSVHVEYEFSDARWTQTFLSRPLTDDAVTELLATAGLRLESYLTADRVLHRAVSMLQDT